jgi:hypothetical protein
MRTGQNLSSSFNGIGRLLVPIAALLALTACAAISPRTQSLGVATAAAGVAATDAALTTYSKLGPLRDQEFINANTANILTVPEPVVKSLLDQLARPDAAESARQERWKTGLKVRKEAASDLQDTYRAFDRLSSGKFGDDTTDAFDKATSAVAAFAKARDNPLSDSPIPGIVGRALGELVRIQQARDIKRHNVVLAELSLQFLELWKADQPAFEQAIDGASNMRLRPAMVGLPSSAFDVAAVGKQVPEPLSAELKLRLYRMRLLSASAAEAETAKAQLRDVGKAFGKLQDAHVELAKDSPSLGDVIDYLDRVIELSKAAEGGDEK